MGLALSLFLRSVNLLSLPTAGYTLVRKVEPSTALIVTELDNDCWGASEVSWCGEKSFLFQPVSSALCSVEACKRVCTLNLRCAVHNSLFVEATEKVIKCVIMVWDAKCFAFGL